MSTRIRILLLIGATLGTVALIASLAINYIRHSSQPSTTHTIYESEDMEKALTDAGYKVIHLLLGFEDTKATPSVDTRTSIPIDRFTAVVSHPSIPSCPLEMEQRMGERIRLDEIGGSDANGFVGNPLDPQAVVAYVRVYKPECLKPQSSPT